MSSLLRTYTLPKLDDLLTMNGHRNPGWVHLLDCCGTCVIPAPSTGTYRPAPS
jgi:hypothetical protein